PRERRAHIRAHQSSAKLSIRQFGVQENAVEAMEIGAAASVEGNDILESLNAAPASVSSKKGKQELKHEAFIDRIKSSCTPYSKVQKRRFNRKQREQLGGGLGSIEAVISALEEEEISSPAEAQPNAATSQQRPQAKAKTGIMGEGKGVPLTKAQRKHALELERLRHPLILTNPQYAANPFQTIRTHAQNTLEKHHGIPPV
ncbi:hypothetical protein OG21DRAFT_1425404, partial [Imleria badia]